MEGLNLKDAGLDNVVDLSGAEQFVNSEIIVSGNHNRIVIGQGATLVNVRMQLLSNGNRVEIGPGCRITAALIMKQVDNNSIVIGAGTTIGGCNFICGEGSSISVGSDCMLAWNLEVRTTDSHAIIDVATGERINPAADIVIEDHVWVGAHATILKGSHIGRDSVVSIRSVVTEKFYEPGLVIGGAPARKLRSGISWRRPLLG
ncbi:acyltransferase [Cupriavidus taiwanensis]|uniref:acyltransferase n=1 Tax=Cupriavidus taiwanensis TaxID=164546 RepID=UPI0025411355|nr:acyltransferase [Cupriavidus taiwanensis]MDK3023792.1 acyltransferase [Cupriavidus taiwanensis]